jgi:hypothetical protein
MSDDKLHTVELPPNLDQEKLAEAALGILSLTLDENGNVWKMLNWDLMNLLFNKGWLQDPIRKTKSVQLTPEGQAVAEDFLVKHFEKKSED